MSGVTYGRFLGEVVDGLLSSMQSNEVYPPPSDNLSSGPYSEYHSCRLVHPCHRRHSNREQTSRARWISYVQGDQTWDARSRRPCPRGRDRWSRWSDPRARRWRHPRGGEEVKLVRGGRFLLKSSLCLYSCAYADVRRIGGHFGRNLLFNGTSLPSVHKLGSKARLWLRFGPAW
jgi:hypothetical protein